MVGGGDGKWMASSGGGAAGKGGATGGFAVLEFKALGQKELGERVGLGVRWEDNRGFCSIKF